MQAEGPMATRLKLGNAWEKGELPGPKSLLQVSFSGSGLVGSSDLGPTASLLPQVWGGALSDWLLPDGLIREIEGKLKKVTLVDQGKDNCGALRTGTS